MLQQMSRSLKLRLPSARVPARTVAVSVDSEASHSSSSGSSSAGLLDSVQRLGAKVTFPDRRDENRKSPVVVLLGWLHGADKHLAKYSAFYDQHGCITIRVPVPAMPLLIGQNLDTGRHLLDLLTRDERLIGRSVVFHTFSNGGSSILIQVRLLLESKSLSLGGLNIRGTIFDSAPARLRWRNSIRATTAHIDDPYWRRLWQVLVVCRLAALSVLRKSLVLAGGRTPYLYDQLQASACRQPELYLYSKADTITPHSDVSELAAHRRQLGVDASEVCWEDSAHVSHMPAHRDEYVRHCLSFVDRCCCCLQQSSRL